MGLARGFACAWFAVAGAARAGEPPCVPDASGMCAVEAGAVPDKPPPARASTPRAPRDPEPELRRGRKEAIAGAVVAGFAAVALAAAVPFTIFSFSCEAYPALADIGCSAGFALLGFGFAVFAVAAAAVGAPLLVTGLVRMRDARVRLQPSASAR